MCKGALKSDGNQGPATDRKRPNTFSLVSIRTEFIKQPCLMKNATCYLMSPYRRLSHSYNQLCRSIARDINQNNTNDHPKRAKSTQSYATPEYATRFVYRRALSLFTLFTVVGYLHHNLGLVSGMAG